MLVVLAIIATVAAMSLPMLLPLMRRRSIDQAKEQVMSALIFARSRAVQSRRIVNVTLLATERAVIVTDYDALRGSNRPPFCAHWLGNYGGASATVAEKAEARFQALKSAAIPNGASVVETLPEGCNFDLSSNALGVGGPYDKDDPARLAITYMFLPSGAVWTLLPEAENDENDANWKKTTLIGGNDKPCGPIIIGPPRKNASEISIVQIRVYAMTGQVSSEQLQ